jgi:hypothetical protein
MGKKWSSVPLTVARYRVPAGILESSVRALREGSSGRREWVILWQGKILDEVTAEITKIHVPRQDTGPLHFNVSIDERLHLLDAVTADGELILAQLHTHPREAFHSEVDDRLAIAKHTGAVSIVVANFGTRWTGDFRETSVNRHLGAGRWRELKPHEVVELLEVVP